MKNRIFSHFLQGIRNQRFGFVLLLVYNVLPFIGLYYWEWDAYSIAWIYWAEAALIAVYELAVGFIAGPAVDDSKSSRSEFLVGGVVFFAFMVIYHLMTYQFIADAVLGYNGGELGSTYRREVFMEYVPIVAIQFLAVLSHYVLKLIGVIRHRDTAVRSTSLLRRWFTTALIPLMMGLIVAQLGDSSAFLAVLIVVVAVKICIDIWYAAGELPIEKGVDELDLRRHPYAVFSVMQMGLLSFISFILLLIVFPDRWDSSVSAGANIVAFAAMIVLMAIPAIPAKVRVWFNKETEELLIYKRKFRTKEYVFGVNEIRYIHKKKTKEGEGPWVVKTTKKDEVKLPLLYLSEIEFYRLLKYIHDHYSEISVRIPKNPPEHHAGARQL